VGKELGTGVIPYFSCKSQLVGRYDGVLVTIWLNVEWREQYIESREDIHPESRLVRGE
jgi:hypothetical protein